MSIRNAEDLVGEVAREIAKQFEQQGRRLMALTEFDLDNAKAKATTLILALVARERENHLRLHDKAVRDRTLLDNRAPSPGLLAALNESRCSKGSR